MCPQSEAEIKEMKNIRYVPVVGSLMYAMTTIRPDNCYAVGLVSRHQI